MDAYLSAPLIAVNSAALQHMISARLSNPRMRVVEEVRRALGGGNMDGMEDRLRTLETTVARMEERFEERFDRVLDRLSELRSDVKNLHWWFLGAVLTILVTVIALAFSVQQMTVATFQAAAQQPSAAPAPIVITIPAPAPAASR